MLLGVPTGVDQSVDELLEAKTARSSWPVGRNIVTQRSRRSLSGEKLFLYSKTDTQVAQYALLYTHQLPYERDGVKHERDMGS